MGFLSKMVIMSVVAAAVMAAPNPDEYNIPAVGNNRRSQYYVLHDDGSFKYGYDTGDDAFESQKTSSSGEVDGQFGYRDEDGQQIRLQYTSGSGGFVARGDHIPKVHPDVAAAFEARRNAAPFVDPLAGADGDRSYNFDFAGEEHSRNEVANSDGTVSGSYSYIDEFGNTKTYRYRAGKGIGFVIEGDDIPKQVEPLASHTAHHAAAVAQVAATRRAQSSGSRFGSSASGSRHGGASHSTKFGGASHRTKFGGASHSATSGASHGSATRHQSSSTSSQRASFKTPTRTYFPPNPTRSSATSFSSSTKHVPSTSTASHGSHSSSFNNRRTSTSQRVSPSSGSARQYEEANTRSSLSPSGRYSVAYETSSHTRQESGDDDNNVRGSFSFRADDDGEERSVNYEAGSATGFIAEGTHLPIGPIVPGAPTGQVTGRIVPVQEIKFIDPLADDDTDSSFDFGFDSETYSRSETADEDGNVVGQYSVLGEDNILRTFRYRAGKGIGFETTEISAVPSRNRATSSTSSASSATFKHGSSTRTAGASTSGASVSSTRTSARAPTSTFTAPKKFGHAHTSHGASTSSFSTRQQLGGSSHKFGGASHSSRSGSDESFTLRQYDPSEGRGKFGYVLRFDN